MKVVFNYLQEHQSLPHPYDLAGEGIENRTILAGRFPIARCRGAIGAKPGGVFAVTEAEEVK
ncbi:hypothetical protein Ahy_B02g058645 [Arachis hypogaea]|uniref:Uncharacterized protein n=1 Tax=Arachis hypogaea TaxID=3818 RepID=A0A445AF17_ARAHY|nr:hypothetical protein Ahy_B02g058645 [Arachis hypogaea]